MTSNREGDLAVWALMGAGMGVYWFFKGFRELKVKRTIQDIPTSRIATGAVGSLVEIKGAIVCEPDQLVPAPVSGFPCVFYSLEIQKLVRTKNSSYWKTIDWIYSDKGFRVDDGSGADALVYAEGAEIKRQGDPAEYRVNSRDLSSMPQGLLLVLTLNANKLRSFKLSGSSWWRSEEYRFLERCFYRGETLYILGNADSGIKVEKRRKLSFKNFLAARKMAETDPALRKKFDANRDGVLDPEELERAAKTVGEQLQPRDGRVEKPLPKTKMIFRKQDARTFIVSNMKEEQVVASLGWSSSLKIFGGPALAIAGMAYIAWFLRGAF
ncbi:MAG: hypothetical protein HY579_00935 [Nitrospinae bacterium]|nr:hypothetical protein [Nitrospinota bacterium]